MTPRDITHTHVHNNISRLLNDIQNRMGEWHELLYDDAEREIFEHWLVSDWLAEKLAAKGEYVETNFYGMSIWGRTTTGQAVKMDRVIQEIAAECGVHPS